MSVRVYPIHPGVIDPRTMRPLPEGGINAELTLYWRRREALGEVSFEAPPVAEPAPDATTTAKKKRTP